MIARLDVSHCMRNLIPKTCYANFKKAKAQAKAPAQAAAKSKAQAKNILHHKAAIQQQGTTMAIARLSVKTGGVGKASAHAEYIERDGKYEKRKNDDLEYSASGNMPPWAAENPNLFWQSADLYERKNGSTYREFEIALPRELNPEQRLELIQDFIDQEIGTKYPYQVAIHNPKAMDGLEQPHAHLMFNERLQDGIERDPQQYFKRYNGKAPEKGGAKKDNTGKDHKTRKDEIKDLRQRWEEMSNRHLERAGLDTRIDMRSYKDQGIDKAPEKKLLPSQAKDPVIREALSQSRQADQALKQHDLGDVSQDLQQLQQSKRLAQDIEQGKAEFKADFEQFKAEALQQFKQQQKLEQQQTLEQQQANTLKPSRGMER